MSNLPVRTMDQRILGFCEELAQMSVKSQHAKFWEGLKILINGLLFKSEFWIKEACEEFSKSKHGLLVPLCDVNYFFNQKLNCYFFQDPDPKQNRNFIKFCLKHEKSKVWLAQKEDLC